MLGLWSAFPLLPANPPLPRPPPRARFPQPAPVNPAPSHRESQPQKVAADPPRRRSDRFSCFGAFNSFSCFLLVDISGNRLFEYAARGRGKITPPLRRPCRAVDRNPTKLFP